MIPRTCSVIASPPPPFVFPPEYRYVNIYTTASDEIYGYSLIHRSCFDSRTLTRASPLNLPPFTVDQT